MTTYSNIFKPSFLFRLTAAFMVASIFLFLTDNFLILWGDFPGISAFISYLGWTDTGRPSKIGGDQITAGWIQFITFILILCALFVACVKSKSRTVSDDAALYSALSAYIVRAAFWGVFLVGLVDMLISFLRVEGFLSYLIGDHLTIQLGRSIFRGTYIHYPLILAGAVIAFFSRSLGFIWLALLIVAAEFTIVLTRFIFSYEQAFMGDLVRFWYAGLFLFASAYTLVHDGHVRVDVLYTNFKDQYKALTNIIGSLLLGLPLCWNILYQGMSGKGSIINSPLLSFEISQSGFGMYTKYLMAGYLIIFAVSMAVQFTAFILDNIASYQSSSHSDDSLKT